MTWLSRELRAVLAVAMVADIMIFSGIFFLNLMAFAIGTALILLGHAYSYRQPAAAGLMVVTATAAASIEITTILEARYMLVAALGLLGPLSVLTWVSLTLQDEEQVVESPPMRPLAFASAYGALCLMSVPATLLVVSFISPGVSLRTTTMTEGAIMLITGAALAVFITMRGFGQPSGTRPPEGSSGQASDTREET